MRGAPLLHDGGRDPGVRRARREGSLDDVPEDLPGHVVEVRRQDDLGAGLGHRLSEHGHGHVGPVGQHAAARAVPRGAQGHLRSRAVRRACGAQQGRPCRRDRLSRLPAPHPCALQQRERGGSRDGQHAVAGVHRAAAQRKRRGVHTRHPEIAQRRRASDDVDQGVVPAEFVQVDVGGRHAVQRALHLGDRGQRRLRHGQAGPGRHRDQLRGRALGGVVVDLDPHAGGGQRSGAHPLGVEPPAGEPGRGDRLPYGVERGPGVEQRAEQHVARESGEGVEVEDHRDVLLVRR